MNSESKGFILLEVMLSLVILGVLLVFCIQGISGHIRAGLSSYNISVAASLGQQILAGIHQGGYQNGSCNGKIEQGTEYDWEVSRNKINEMEARYEVRIKWREHGVEKDLNLVTSRLEKSE